MHIRSLRATRRLVVTKRHLIVFALGLAMVGLAPAPQVVAQGAIGPAPKSPAPAPVAPPPHVVTPPTLPPPTAAPAITNPLANQPHATGQDDAKRSASDTGDQPAAPAVATGRRQYEPLRNLPVTAANKAGGAPSRIVTDGNGGFNFGKLASGNYKLAFESKIVVGAGPGGGPNVASPQPQAVLIALLLPAVQKTGDHAPGATRVIRITNIRANATTTVTVGKDGSVTFFDWGDGKGPVDLRKEATVPLPKDAQPGELRGTLTAIFPTTTSGTGNGANALRRQYEPLLIRKNFIAGVGDFNGDGRFQTDNNGTFSVGKLAPGEYLLGIADNESPLPRDRPLLISLLLPAVQPAREATVIEHRFASADDALNVSFRMGKDGRVMALDWGDGNGPVDFAKETRYIPLPQAPSPNELRLSLSGLPSGPSPQTTRGDPLPGKDVGLEHDPAGIRVSVNKTDAHGNFTFGKLEPGNYALKLNSKDIITGAGPGAGPQKIVAVLIGILLPAEATASGNYVEHAFTGTSASSPIKIAFRIGKDGRVMSIDWGDGGGPIDPAKEARTLPLPQGAQPGELNGTLKIFDRWGNF